MKKRTFFQRAFAWVLALVMVIGSVTVPGVNTLQSNASALGESGGETSSQENSGGSGAGGETTGPATPETYTVDIVSESTEYYPEEPVTLTAQVKNSSGTVIPMDGITVTWSIITGADSATLSDVSASTTHLTINKNVVKGTSLEVKVQCKNADVSVDCEKTLNLNTSVRETITVSGKVYDSYAPGGTQTAIAGAEITFEQTEAPVNKQVKVTAGNDGSYSVTLYKGISYSVHIVKGDYQVFDQTGLSFLADINNNDIHMEINGSLAISGTNEIFVDQTVQLTAAVTGKLGNVSWEIVSANKNDATVSPVSGTDGKNADFKALKAGSYEVKVSAHSIVSDSFTINVKKKTPALDVAINPEKDGNWYSGVVINSALKDGDKKLSNQTIDIYIDGTKVGSVTTDNNGAAAYTWKEVNGVVKDTYSIEVKYGGNTDYYSEAVWGSANYSLSKLGQSFEFDGSNTVDKLTYGDVYYIKLKDILPDSSVSEADRENYKASTSFTFEVNDAGKGFVEVGKTLDTKEGGYPVKVVKGGASNVKITVTQEANDFYNASQKELTITSIDKKEVSLVDVQAEEKTYDGRADNIKVTAKLNLVDIEEMDKAEAENVIMLSITNGSVDKADAAPQAAVTAKFAIPQALADKYSLKDNGEVPANTVFVKIKPAPLSLTLGNASIDYSLIPDVSKLEYEENIERISVSGFIGDDLKNNPPDFQLPNIYIDTVVLGTEIEVEKSYDVLKAEENTGNSTNNYYFDFKNQSPGKLTLLVESVKTYCDYIAYDDAGSKNTSQDSATLIYYGVNQPVAKFKILSEKKENYSQIILVKDGQDSKDITETGIELETKYAEVSYQAYLSNDKGTKKTSVFDLPVFKRDDKEPNVSITIAEVDKAFDKFLETLTFGLFHNTSMKADISVADPVVEGLSSGVRSWSYYIAEVEEDVTFTPQASNHTLTSEEFKKQFPDAAFELIPVKSDDDLIKTISIGDKGNNNYIVFVIAVDKVGNSCLYGSNGVIIENVEPGDIVVQYGTESGNKDGYFNSCVNLNVTASENTLKSRILSGIASVKYKVEKDGKTVTTDGQGGSFNEVLFNSDVSNTTLQNLKDHYANITCNTTILVEDGSIQTKDESKEVRVTFTATDFAGNENMGVETFVIDPVKPEIKSEYSEASNKHEFDGNEVYYYKDKVVLTTTIKERFLDIDNDVKYYIHSSDPMTKSSDPMTLGNLRNSENWEKYGIKDVVIDHSEENRTDQSISKITITFDGERDYTVWTSVTDKAGNSNKTEARNFVIDKTAPVVTVSYKDIKFDRTFVPSKEEAHRTYLDSKSEDGIEVEIKINEKNFFAEDVVLTITAEDINNKSIDIPVSRWEFNEDVHTYSFILNNDANYTLDIKYTDLAKNLAVYTYGMTQKGAYDIDYFTLDRVIPVGKITVKQLIFDKEEKEQSWLQSFLESITFNWFGKDEVSAIIEGSDDTSGLKSIKYITTSELLNKYALSKRNDWKEYSGELTNKANQNIIVYQRVEDMAGNVAYYSTDNVVIDNVSAEIEVAVKPEAPGRQNGIYSKAEIDAAKDAENGGFSIYIKDPAAADNDQSYAGIKSIQYRLTAVSDTGETVYITDQENEGYILLPSFTSTDSKAHISEHKSFVKLQPFKEHSYHYTIRVLAEDWSGNKTESIPVTITVDPISPEIKNDFESVASILNGKYYNKDVKLTTTITERYLDIYKDVIYDINKTQVTLEQLIANKEQYGVSSVVVKHDSNELTRTDASESTITVVFHADNEYLVSTSVMDKAGNGSGTEAYNFVVDQTAPEATLTYYSYGKGDTFTAGTGPDNITYLGQDYSSFAVEVTVEELNFTLGGTVNADFTSTAKNSKGENLNALGVELTGYTDNGKKADAWTNPGETTHKYRVNVQNDANYTFDFAYTDLAGNPLKVKVPSGYVTLDKTLPDGTVTIDGLVNGNGENGTTSQSWANKFIESITFGLFGKNNMSATMTSDDATAGVAKTEYITTSEFLTKDTLARRMDWTGYTSAVSLYANQNVIVYEKVTDKAGNVEYFSTQNLVADNVNPAPVVTMTPSSPAWGKGVYSAGDNPGFDISVTDPVVNDAYSGLKEITYKIVNGTNGDTESGTLATFDNIAHQQSWTGHVSIDPERFYSNDVQVTVYASDWSTNEATSETARLKVDNKAPIVKFSFDTSDALNGKYYRNNKTLTITVDERNFDPSYTPTVTSTAGGVYSFNGWSTNEEITTGTITFSGDSDYTVTFDCYDLAGNRSNTERQEEFTVDKTLPVINVAYDNNSALNGNYYKASRTATVTITEHNFRASEVRVTTTASLDGKAISAPNAGGWSSNGDRHTAVISYPADGDYTFDITYTDLAGNASADYAMDSFTVDLTNPEIEITGIKDKSANKGTVAPVITFTDVNFATENVTLTLTAANKGKVPVDGLVSRANRNNGTTVTFKNFGKDMDDIYTLTAKTTDKAGNETSKSISFSVNRNGSMYEIDSATQAMLKTGFTNDPKDIVIKEINVDTLEFIEITYSKDGKVVKLKEGTDYTVKAEGGEGQWKKYTYTIKAECFEEEGEYSINIYSEDRAANTSTNKVKAKNLEFIVDKTPPVVSIANLENRGRYREDIHQFTLSVKDNTVLSYVQLYIDGELVRTYSGDELTVVDGVITIDVDSSSSYQNIKLIAYDAAGNPTEPVEYEVLVTSSWWVQFFMNKPLFFGCIAALLIVVAGAALLVVKAKKKR